ncbi:MAG: hypothetical protein E5Y41_00275, partial [Mesorhizobium sp.]
MQTGLKAVDSLVPIGLRYYCLYSLPGKWVYYFERSEHGNRYGTKTDYLFQYCSSLRLVRKLPTETQPILSFIAKTLLSLALLKVALGLGYVFMEDLTRAVAQFYPSSSGGGGFNQPPFPEGDSALPVLGIENPNLDQPGPSASDGEGQAVREGERAARDLQEEETNIKNLKTDPLIRGSFRTALIKQESIIQEVKKLLPPGNGIADSDIRVAIECYLTPTMELSTKYRTSKLAK